MPTKLTKNIKTLWEVTFLKNLGLSTSRLAQPQPSSERIKLQRRSFL